MPAPKRTSKNAPPRGGDGQAGAVLSPDVLGALGAMQRRAAERVVRASYRAAQRHRLSPSRMASSAGTFDSHLTTAERDQLIRRARDLHRNDPVARGMVERRVNLTVGSGFRPRATTADPAWNDAHRELWRQWHFSCEHRDLQDFDDLTRSIVRQRLVDGDVVVLPVAETGRLQLVDAERLRNPGDAYDSLEWRGGVWTDRTGRPMALNIVQWTDQGKTASGNDRLLAIDPNALGNPWLFGRIDWSSQTRGESPLATVAEDFGRLRDYIESVEEASHLFALVAFVHKTDDPRGAARAMGATTEVDEDGLAYTSGLLRGGAISYIGLNESMEAVQSSQPMAEFDPFVRARMRFIGSAMGMPIELAMLDFSQSNFHGALAAVEVAMEDLRDERRWLTGCLRKVYLWKTRQWIEQGLLEDRPDWESHRWTPPRRVVLEPMRQAKVDAQRLEKGISTYEDVLEAEGRDWEEVFEQRAEEKRRMAELGIDVAVTPGAGSAAGAANGGKAGTQPGNAAPDGAGDDGEDSDDEYEGAA